MDTESNQEVAELTIMDSLVNNLTLNGIIIVQTFLCITINLSVVMLLTVSLVEVIVVIPVSP